MANDFITVTVLNNYIKNIMDAEEVLHNISLAGEVSGIKCSGPHSYFTLKDTDSQISCCCFSYRKTYLPKEGESVVLKGSIDYYSRGGKITFIAAVIEPLGIGMLALKLEELKKKLEKEGYFLQEHKLAIPKFCENICVITSKSGAVIRDIITTARKNNKRINIDVYDVKVQGQGSAESIINALNIVDKLNYDAILIARGGGSLEDLMSFNDERLVYAIYNALTPIVSAVGHETDYTLCDFAADIRVPTPTAGAELLAYDTTALFNQFNQYNFKMKRQLSSQLSNQYYRLISAARALVGSARLVVEGGKNQVSHINQNFGRLMNIMLSDKEHQLRNIITKIDSNNPTKIFKQGYYKLYDSNKLSIEIDKLSVGDGIIVQGDKGRLYGSVDKVELDK